MPKSNLRGIARWRPLASASATLGTVLLAFVPFGLAPLVVAVATGELSPRLITAFVVPAALAMVAGALLRLATVSGPLRSREALLVVVAGWVIYALLGSLPLWVLLRPVSFLDAVFESVSGLTTTGITVLEGLDSMSKTLLFWRAELQFLGGLGILTFFLAVTSRSGEAPFHLFTAESHKISSPRLTPSISRSIKFILGIYVGLVVLFGFLFALEGMSVFDAATHAMTSLSTGGFSTHDASIGYFQAEGFAHYKLIEWTVIAAMLAGGINFFVHFRVLRGQLDALWDTSEVRLYWFLLAGVVVLVVAGIISAPASQATAVTVTEEHIRTATFQAAALLSSTGYGTRSLASPFFPLVAQPLFLLLMVVGGCVGSTTGGVKVLRVVILYNAVKREVRRLYNPRRAVQPLVVDGQVVSSDEVVRTAALFFGWLTYAGIATVVTMLATSHGLLGSLSGALSMVGNMGPTYLPGGATVALPVVVKLVYISGMLAGRLELLPVLLFLSPRAWR